MTNFILILYSNFLFSTNTGKFLYKLDQRGRGPNEYVYLSDYDIKPEENLVIVLTRGKLYFYNETDTGFNLGRQLDLKMQPSICRFLSGPG